MQRVRGWQRCKENSLETPKLSAGLKAKRDLSQVKDNSWGIKGGLQNLAGA